jgi:hypothetical protein
VSDDAVQNEPVVLCQFDPVFVMVNKGLKLHSSPLRRTKCWLPTSWPEVSASVPFFHPDGEDAFPEDARRVILMVLKFDIAITAMEILIAMKRFGHLGIEISAVRG